MDRRSTVVTKSETLHQSSIKGTSVDPKVPTLSNWSVNFLSVARDRISSLASSLATSVDGQGSFSSGSSSISRRRGSWSPAEAAAYFYAAQQKAQQQQQTGSFIYSIDSDLSFRSSGSSSILTPSSRGGYFNRRSTQSMKILRTNDLPFSIPIVDGGNSKAATAASANQFQTTSFTVAGAAAKKAQCGSLESVDFDEEDDDDVSSTASSVDSGVQRRLGSSSDCSFDSSSSSPSHLHHHSSPSFLRSTSGFISSDYDHSATSLYRPGGANLLDDTFTRTFGYQPLDEIELYSELHKLLESKRAGSSCAVEQDQNTDNNGTGRRGCSKPVTRFGLGYEDHCMFPLVLPVFLNECLQKKNNSYVTWDYIKLMADAELCRMELATLRNLR